MPETVEEIGRVQGLTIILLWKPLKSGGQQCQYQEARGFLRDTLAGEQKQRNNCQARYGERMLIG